MYPHEVRDQVAEISKAASEDAVSNATDARVVGELIAIRQSIGLLAVAVSEASERLAHLLEYGLDQALTIARSR